MKVAIIPARGGSVRIPRKNIRDFFGKPVIAYSIDTAKRSELFDSIWVSTEDPEIAAVARRYGAGVIPRPPELAEIGAPDCGTQEVTRHAVEWLKRGNLPIEQACCIYATAPMLTPVDLAVAHGILVDGQYPYVYTNGWFYFGTQSSFVNGVPLEEGIHVVPDRARWVDINTELDWGEAERKYATMHGIERKETDYHPV